MSNLVHKLRARRDDGASAVEYGLLVALIAVVIAGTVFVLGTSLRNKFQSTNDCLNSTGQNCATTAPTN